MQKDIFLSREGDEWYRRNEKAIREKDFSTDALVLEIQRIADGRQLQILELGCGEGSRLAHLQTADGHTCFGVDPSGVAVETCKAKGVEAQIGTAERIAFPDHSFDVVVFGFCLYMCDDSDLFRVAMERSCREAFTVDRDSGFRGAVPHPTEYDTIRN